MCQEIQKDIKLEKELKPGLKRYDKNRSSAIYGATVDKLFANSHTHRTSQYEVSYKEMQQLAKNVPYRFWNDLERIYHQYSVLTGEKARRLKNIINNKLESRAIPTSQPPSLQNKFVKSCIKIGMEIDDDIRNRNGEARQLYAIGMMFSQLKLFPMSQFHFDISRSLLEAAYSTYSEQYAAFQKFRNLLPEAATALIQSHYNKVESEIAEALQTNHDYEVYTANINLLNSLAGIYRLSRLVRNMVFN